MFLKTAYNNLNYSRYSLFTLISKRFSLSRFSHPFHLVDPSVWPLVVATAVFYMALGGVKAFQGLTCFVFDFIFEIGLALLAASMLLWLHDVMVEATFEGRHTAAVRNGLKWGFILFIVSEVFFFAAFFWGFFHMSLAPSIELGAVWPPVGIKTLNAFGVPLVNTLILLLSGVWVTSAHAFFASSRYFEPKELKVLVKLVSKNSIDTDTWFVGDAVTRKSLVIRDAELEKIEKENKPAETVNEFFRITLPRVFQSIRLLTIHTVLLHILRVISPVRYAYWSLYEKFGEYSKFGGRVSYWSSELDLFTTVYKPVSTNVRKFANVDFYDETSYDFDLDSNSSDILNSSEEQVFPRMQTIARISWLRSLLREYLLVMPKDYYNQLGINEFSIMANSSTALKFNLLQKKYSVSSILNSVNFLKFNKKSSIFSGKPALGLYHWVPKNEDAAYRIRVAALLGLIFLVLQYGEYTETTFDITDSVYGSLFFVATGFHGFHVFVGMVMLAIASARASAGHFFSSSALGFEAAAWYWHFVDVVWLFLYIFVYHWGS